jgi:hypothetical protein
LVLLNVNVKLEYTLLGFSAAKIINFNARIWQHRAKSGRNDTLKMSKALIHSVIRFLKNLKRVDEI